MAECGSVAAAAWVLAWQPETLEDKNPPSQGQIHASGGENQYCFQQLGEKMGIIQKKATLI